MNTVVNLDFDYFYYGNALHRSNIRADMEEINSLLETEKNACPLLDLTFSRVSPN